MTWIKTTLIYYLPVLEVRPPKQCLWAAVRRSTQLVPAGGSRGDSVPLPFLLLEAAHIPWLVVPASIFKVSSRASSSLSPLLLHHHITFYFLTLLSQSYQDPGSISFLVLSFLYGPTLTSHILKDS